MKVYVLRYGGWMTSLNEKRQAKALSKALDDVDAKYIKGKHYAAGYNRSVKHHLQKQEKQSWLVSVCMHLSVVVP